MNIILNHLEARVLASLIEKEITTPDYYPLSLNALVHACNQKNNRDPVTNLDEGAVRQALRGLEEVGLAGVARGADGRVTKYEHRAQEVFNFHRDEIAILCELLLRGPQTPGELRGRAERMHRFDGLDGVQSALQRLMKREPPLAAVLPRQAGTKESRYAHLLTGAVEAWQPGPDLDAPSGDGSPDGGRMARLEDDVRSLQNDLATIRREFDEFRRRFE